MVTVVFENANAGTVLQQGPFERYLIARYGYASSYYSVCHPSAPNYLALTSGSSLQCGSDGYSVYSKTNIADQVSKGGLTWAAYMESMPSPCYTGNTHFYAVRHDPFVYYQDIVDNSSRCSSHVLNFTSWNDAVNSSSIPNYVFISPNVLNDGHNTNVSYADSWLKGWLSPLLNDSWAQSTAFFIVYDESSGSSSGYDGLNGGRVYFTAVGPDVRMNSTIATNTSHYNLLTTTEWLLGLNPIGGNDTGTSFPPMTSLFRTPSTTLYSLSGRVLAQRNGSPLLRANVTVAGVRSTYSNISGDYQFSLSNGTYSVGATAPGFVPETTSLTIAGKAVIQNFSLKGSEYLVSGGVFDSSGGAPIGGAAILLGTTLESLTNATGNFTFSIASGTYLISAAAAGYATVATSIVMKENDTTLNFLLPSLSPRTYALSGTVSYQSNRTVAAGALVYLNWKSPERTGSNGSFLFNIPNGTYNLTVEMGGFYNSTTRINIHGYPYVMDAFLVSNRTYQLAGTVYSNETRQYLSGAIVSLNSDHPQTTDAEGNFLFAVKDGTYTLTISCSGYISTNRTISINASSRPANLSVYLIPEPLPSRGRILPSAWPSTYVAGGVIVIAAIGGVAAWVALRRRSGRGGLDLRKAGRNGE